ncbi:hypothetical protein ID854_06135 [Xenorhabdus sp. M]|uniref:Uncharacterized protein n=2 Tax=Xenorhabdus szentirmaii TaxID=290112 RepID=A0AAW3YPV5_9GAMM|nr:hypothetical protein [Xenorhabdus sp. M]
MIDINKELEKISETNFFSKMGLADIHDGNIIVIKNVEKAFIKPSNEVFNGYYKNTEWLPISHSQEDPFYGNIQNSKQLIEIRLKISKAIMCATKALNESRLKSGAYDFNHAARNSISYAFRQYISEKYLNLGDKWEKIIKIYYSGHWPIGFYNEKIIII